MKTFILFLSIIIISSSFTMPYRLQALSIEGKWVNRTGDEKIEIYQKSNQYFGKIIWLKEDASNKKVQPLLDLNNPDAKQRNQPLVGLEIIKNLENKGQHVWRGGTAYDYSSGRTYNCQIALRDSNVIDIRKFFGLTLMGQTEQWNRLED